MNFDHYLLGNNFFIYKLSISILNHKACVVTSNYIFTITLMIIYRLFPTHYKFFPRAFILPDQLSDLLNCFNTSKLKTYILKPDNGSQV